MESKMHGYLKVQPRQRFDRYTLKGAVQRMHRYGCREFIARIHVQIHVASKPIERMCKRHVASKSLQLRVRTLCSPRNHEFRAGVLLVRAEDTE